jgi:hypothetical protein
MPELITFRGRPIKRRSRTPSGLHLVFFSAVRGIPGLRLDVTEDEWNAHGRIEFFPDGQKPDVRALAARAND